MHLHCENPANRSRAQKARSSINSHRLNISLRTHPSIKRRSMERRFRHIAQHALLLLVQRIKDPLADLLVSEGLLLGYALGEFTVAVLGRFFVLFGDGVRFEERGEPRVLQQHGVCGAEVGDFR